VALASSHGGGDKFHNKTSESMERMVNAHYCLVEKAFPHGMPWIFYLYLRANQK
jgi:hypothetical protein